MQGNFLQICAIVLVCVSGLRAQHAGHKEKECSVIKAGYKFSFTLYKELAMTSKNLIFSPYSIATATAMVMLGTRGQTELELKRFLQYGTCNPNSLRIHLTHKRVREFIEKPSEDVTLTVVNKIFPDKSFLLRPSYNEKSERYYGSEVQPLDFMRHPEEARNTINEWAENNTNGIIKNLLPPGSVDSLTQAVLANAIYFKGTWTTQFNPRNTVERDFHVDETTSMRTDFMTNKAVYKYATNALFTLVELPYNGDTASMIILLPREQFGLATMEDKVLDGDFLRALNHYGYPREVRVRIPKFKMDYMKELKSSYVKLGVKTLFGPAADFSEMSESSGMFISEIRHKAYIEVNEEGTEAAAASAFAGTRSLSMGAPVFNCDHPFLFYIVHKRSQAILFLGRYITPTK